MYVKVDKIYCVNVYRNFLHTHCVKLDEPFASIRNIKREIATTLNLNPRLLLIILMKYPTDNQLKGFRYSFFLFRKKKKLIKYVFVF